MALRSEVMIAARDRRQVAALHVPLPDQAVREFRALLAALPPAAFAALLLELGVALYNREIRQWAVLTDISGELLDEATHRARERITDQWLASPGPQALDPEVQAARRRARLIRKGGY